MQNKDKIIIGIDQSYKDTGITILNSKKEILKMSSIKFDCCKNKTEKRNMMCEVLERQFKTIANPNNNDVRVITERIRLQSQGFISQNYIMSTSALVATIKDVCVLYKVPVFEVDTRAWKSAIVGSSKPLDNKYGIDPKKYRTILYLKELGLLKYIVEEYKGRGKKGVIRVNKGGKRIPCKINDNIADSYCIALYGLLPKNKQKLHEVNI